MEKLDFAEEKIVLAQTILALQEIELLEDIKNYIENILAQRNSRVESKEDDFNVGILNFEEWNKQFEEEKNLDDYIPEYEMKLRDFRMNIYSAEKGNNLSKKEFMDKINNWK